MTADGLREEPNNRLPPLLLAVLATLGALPVVRSLLVSDLSWCYPYVTSDSYDWIANGLYWAGENVGASWRPPGLPLVIAMLFKTGLLAWLPVVNTLVLGLTTAALYLLLRERHSAWISACASWFFFANDYVQDLTKYLLADIYCTLFIVLAALFFVRAAREPRHYRTSALLLGVGFLFHSATVVAGIGFAAAVVLTRRTDLRRREIWQGLGGAAFLAGGWAVARGLHYHFHPTAPRHGVEDLLYLSAANLRFYAIAAPALLGLAILPLYGAGFLRLVTRDYPDRAWRSSVVAPFAALLVFWLFFYDWGDKRFLYYLFPFCICFLAEGLDALVAWARRGRLAALLACVYVAVAVLWNQIRYPSYGVQYLALTPQDFLEASVIEIPAPKGKVVYRLAGARIVRLHGSFLASFSRSLFDVRIHPAECSVPVPSPACLVALKADVDHLFGLGEAVGFSPPGSPDVRASSAGRLGDILGRRVVSPAEARLALIGRGTSLKPPLATCGPYALVPDALTVQFRGLSQDSSEALREELEKTRAELSQARARIAAMEMSFFWKLRNAWWKLKARFAGGGFFGRAGRPACRRRSSSSFPVSRPFASAATRSLARRTPWTSSFSRTTIRPFSRSASGLCSGTPVRRIGSSSPIRACRPSRANWLEAFARDQGAALVDGAGAFQQARDAGTSPHVLLLDGRARVTADILDRLISCLASDPNTAGVVPLGADLPLVGPVFERAARELADGDGAPATLLAAESARFFPASEEGGGSALLVRRPAVRSGGSESSPREVLARMRGDGRRILLADDTWIAGAVPSAPGAPDRVIEGIASRLAFLPELFGLRESARRRFEGRRVLYVLPVLERGGGSNVVLSEARAMARMGVEARVFNLAGHRTVFEKSYPAPGVPIVYGRESDLVEAAQGFDAVIGTAHYSVPWMVPLAKLPRPPVLGYCIQDYEPLFYAEGSEDWKRAFASYGLVPGMRRFSKSKWNADEVVARTDLDCALVSASFDAEVFRPRLPEPAATPVRIAAMVRPSTPRRQPGLTVDVMRTLAQKLGDRVEIVLFGSERSDPALRAFRLDFPHRFLGVLDDRQLSALLSQVHVFADLSTYQALGVASLEAMASGAAVVVPKAGGAGTFARHDVNALAVDTSSREECIACLERLATDESLLRRLAAQAIVDAGFHTPDRAAAGILEVLFA